MNLQSKADRVFSHYIRHRDCPDGQGRCISCGRPITPSTCDCGHYVPRSHLSTRYDTRNCNAQCLDCNRMRYGNLPGYTRGLMRKYGSGIVDELIRQGRESCKLWRSDYEEIIETYKQKSHEIDIGKDKP